MKIRNFFTSGLMQLWLFFIFCAVGSWAGWVNEVSASAESRRISALALLGFLAASQLFVVVAFQMKRIQVLETKLTEINKQADQAPIP